MSERQTLVDDIQNRMVTVPKEGLTHAERVGLAAQAHWHAQKNGDTLADMFTAVYLLAVQEIMAGWRMAMDNAWRLTEQAGE